MSCLAAPPIPLPTLPSGFGFGATIPPFNFDVRLCCKILPFPIAIPPIPIAIGVQVPPAILIALDEAKTVLLAYIDQLQISCPFEGD